MKKTITFLLSLLIVMSLAACGNSSDQTDQASAESSSAENSTDDTADAETDETQQGETDVQGSRILVAYFSATNTTKGVAEHIANGLGADLYEIVPEEPYTDADLDYNDNNSRSTIEMNDPDARPAISGSVENMEQYDIVFIGYPIWWGEAPRIVSTFAESYDFSGKTIVPFATSGGSGFGRTNDKLKPSCPGATLTEGKMLNGRYSEDSLKKWIEDLKL